MKEKNSNGMGSLTYVIRNDKKYWTGRVTLGFNLEGEQVRRSYSSYKKSEVIEKMKKALSTTGIAGFVNKGDESLEELMGYWLYNIKSKNIKSTTLAKYDQTYRLRIEKSVIGKVEIKNINILVLQKYIDNLINSENISFQTIKNTLTLIKSFLNYTIKIGILQSNPADFVTLPKEKKKKDNSKKYNVFSYAEQQLILKNLNLDDFVEQALYIDFFTGLRHGELRGLKSKNFIDDSLKIDQQLNREYEFTESGSKKLITKNASTELKTETAYRIIPLPDMANNLLQKIKVQAAKKYFRMGKKFTDDSLLLVDDLLMPIEEKRLNRRLQSICKKLNLEKRTLHSIRHSYATRLFEAGIDVKTVQGLMGHKDYSTTLNIYTHVMPEKKAAAVEILSKMFS